MEDHFLESTNDISVRSRRLGEVVRIAAFPTEPDQFSRKTPMPY
jgi:hypothetical protein